MQQRSRGMRGVVGLVAFAALVAAGCAHRGRHGEECPYGGDCPYAGEPRMAMHAMHHGFTSDVDTVQIVSAQVGGKNVYIPSTIVVTDAGPRTLSIFNTTDTPHGFAIDALGIAVVVPPGQEVQVPLPPLRGGQVLRIHCQMHPPHRSATLVVLPGAPPEGAPPPPPGGAPPAKR